MVCGRAVQVMIKFLDIIFSLDGGDNDLASNLAKHCVLELPDKTGKIPKVELKDDEVKNDEYRLLYQVISRKHWKITFNDFIFSHGSRFQDVLLQLFIDSMITRK